MEFKELPPVKEQLMKCVRCGKCRSVCPVFAEVKNETTAPRGHVFMVQMLRDGQVNTDQNVYDHLSSCLMCETCSINCPSGIDIHELNAAARSYVYKRNSNPAKNLIFDTMWTRPALLKNTIRMMWGVQKSGAQKLARQLGLTKILPGDIPKAEQILSDVPFRSARSQLSSVNQARGEKKYTVGYFLGCATDLLNPGVALATIDVLTRNGCEVIIPTAMKCCGLPHIANGKLETAQALAKINLKVFNSYDFDYIVTDCASCSSALSAKNLEFVLSSCGLEDEIKKFSDKVVDLTSFLVNIIDIKIPDGNRVENIMVTYHDPCHLANAQGIKAEPRELIKRVPGAELVEMKDANRCCGGSGTYSLTHYDLSMQILDKKMDNVAATGADLIATCCPSCMMQLNYGVRRKGLKARVVHPVELLSHSYKS
ncbi:MAG: (Fe-S)-binding protein [Syntrophomonadaceae bacterium]|nr:(Fe-S)-binding protein [Syntrophomonadaceae bacterium]